VASEISDGVFERMTRLSNVSADAKAYETQLDYLADFFCKNKRMTILNGTKHWLSIIM